MENPVVNTLQPAFPGTLAEGSKARAAGARPKGREFDRIAWLGYVIMPR